MTAEVEWALLKAKVVRLEEELAVLREETIVSLQVKTDKLCRDFSTVKNIAIGMAIYYSCQQMGLTDLLKALL